MKLESVVTIWSEYLPFFSKYVDDLHVMNGGHKTNAVDMLCHFYGDYYVFPIVNSAKNNPELAMKWQEQLIQVWVDENADPKIVFKSIERKHKLLDILTNPIFSFWIHYFETYNKANKSVEINEIQVLVYSHGKGTVFKSLEELEKIDGMEDLASKLSAQYKAKYPTQNVHSSN